MSVWQQVENEPAALFGAEGELVTVSVAVDAHFLEDVLEVLADLSFPVNPEIYHEAALVSVYDERAAGGCAYNPGGIPCLLQSRR